jgi:ubiquinone/menaquinone biosynthesis C-methylase UbiE
MSNEGKTVEQIQQYWEQHGRQELGEETAPLKKRDETLQGLIEDSMINYLRPGHRLLDIGCGDGTSTLRFHKITGTSLGVDFAHKRIEMAKNVAANVGATDIEFAAGDIMNLGPIIERHGQFDICTIIRCLINLPTWSDQAKGIDEIAKSIKPGGLFLASEGWRDGLDAISTARERIGLDPIRLVVHNRYMTRREFENQAARYFEFVDYINLGFYLFMSRVFQPAFVVPDPPSHDHQINVVAGRMAKAGLGRSDFDIYDYAGIYIFRRRNN